MARKPKKVRRAVPDEPEILHAGRRLFRPIEQQLRALRDAPAHGNRELFYDHLVAAHLIAFFNSSVKSLRRIEDVFESPDVRKRLSLPRVPKSTLSDAQRVFDPKLLLPIIEELKGQVPVLRHDPRLDALVKELIAVDGTFMAQAARVVWAVYNKPNAPDAKPQKGCVRIDFHFNILRCVPEQAVVSGGRLAEQDSLVQHVQPGKFYVIDRAMQGYQHAADVIAVGSDLVFRLRDGAAVFDVVEERPLTPADRRAGVIRDVQITIPSPRAKPLEGTPLRVVEFSYIDRSGEMQTGQLLTNRLDLPAEIIALIYRYRWQIELFFRWLKCLVGWKHFFSESQNGVTLQTYIALIATLLLAIEVGAQPSVYDFAMACHVVSGLIPLEEAKPILERRRRERQRAKERAALKRAQKTQA
jgi:hypothetical protein